MDTDLDTHTHVYTESSEYTRPGAAGISSDILMIAYRSTISGLTIQQRTEYTRTG
jgi:hypothetical protein